MVTTKKASECAHPFSVFKTAVKKSSGSKPVQKRPAQKVENPCPYEICNGKTYINLWGHINRSHKGIKRPKKECPYEKCKGRAYAHLNEHINVVHKNIKQIPKKEPCPYEECKKKEYVNLAQHLKYTHGDQKYKCDQCEKVYKRKFSLVTHVRQRHTDPSEYKHTCMECSMTFTCHSQMKCHIDAVHKKKKNYQCDQCEMSFL